MWALRPLLIVIFSIIDGTKYFPAIGGRNAEQVQDVLGEPCLTTRDRLSPLQILKSWPNASDEVARVLCVIVQGQLEVVVLPRYALLRSVEG